jgi:hypothetical protein
MKNLILLIAVAALFCECKVGKSIEKSQNAQEENVTAKENTILNESLLLGEWKAVKSFITEGEEIVESIFLIFSNFTFRRDGLGIGKSYSWGYFYDYNFTWELLNDGKLSIVGEDIQEGDLIFNPSFAWTIEEYTPTKLVLSHISEKDSSREKYHRYIFEKVE